MSLKYEPSSEPLHISVKLGSYRGAGLLVGRERFEEGEQQRRHVPLPEHLDRVKGLGFRF